MKSGSHDPAPIAVGVVGLGRSGWLIHCAHLKDDPKYRVVAVADPMEERRAEAMEKLGVERTYAEPKDLFRDQEVELVVLATPSHTHKDLAVRALEAGKHTLVEKPLAVDTHEADEMIAASRRAGKLLTCFQSRRLDPDFLEIRSLIDQNVIGRVFLVRNGHYHFTRRRDWQTLRSMGGGMLYNWGAHLIDQALLLIDGKVKELYSDLRRTVSAGDAEDHVKVCLKGENGLTVDVEIFSAAPMPLPEWVVIGERGMIKGSRSRLEVKWVDEGVLPPIEADPGAAEGRRYGSREEIPWRHREIDVSKGRQAELFYDSLYKSVREGKPLLVTPESVRNQLDVLERCRAGFVPE